MYFVKSNFASRRRRLSTRAPRGFALIITISLMVLLVLLAVGLLSLSMVTLRSSSNEVANSEARANARLALSIALGELQRSMGPDQRISASGEILGEEDSESSVMNPHWTGVWDSWKAEDAASVDGYSRHQTVDGRNVGSMHPTYVEGREDHFRSWLVSLPPESGKKLSTAVAVQLEGDGLPGADSTAVRLVGRGTLGQSSDSGNEPQGFVDARLLKADTGRFAWWVGDESQKARLMDDSYLSDPPSGLAAKLFREQAPGSTGTTTVVGLENLGDDSQLAGLPSLQTLDVVDGSNGQPSRGYHDLTPFSYEVLADVREGGLKRDLSTLLEHPIRYDRGGDVTETDDDHMLYKFNTKDGWIAGNDNQEAVPIHDVAAFYQLYDGYRSGWKEGIRYSSNVLSNGIQVVSPDYGDKSASGEDSYRHEYTTLYRQPVPVKVQFLLSMFAEPITPQPRPTRDDPNPDTHMLRVGVTPSVTLWNPNNVPLTMRFDSNPDLYAQMTRMANLPLNVRWRKNNGEFISDKKNLFWMVTGGRADGYKPHLFNLYFSGKRPIRFGPGEVRVFSLPFSGDVTGIKNNNNPGGHWGGWKNSFFFKTDKYYEPHEVVAGWEPQSYMLYNASASGNGKHIKDNKLTFKSGDNISFEITADNTKLAGGNPAMMFHFIQTNHQSYAGGGTWDRRNYQFTCRNGGGSAQAAFNEKLMAKGFPSQRTGVLLSPPRSGSNIIARSNNEEGWPFMQFSLMAGTETSEKSNGGSAGGRKYASRPFLHSTPIAAPFIDDTTPAALYNAGWNWWIEEINEVLEAPVQVSEDNDGYYGGGYTPESGTTHVVQQEIPVAPPIAIASLSHAHLGGFSIANDTVGYSFPDHQQITATGQAGLFPHTLQAIGNSYAHPLIPPDEAYVDFSRTFDTGQGSRKVTLADHSYLANKALWDEYFFSSITPQPASVKVFGNRGSRSAEDVAAAFFFENEPLPNRRLTAYMTGLDEDALSDMFDQADEWRDGLADKIAAHLMVEGPFNVNSTSVEAWKVLLSSLKAKPVAYLDKDKALDGGVDFEDESTDGTPVAGFTLPNGKPVSNSGADPSDSGQWYSWRELNDTEIDELAKAIVRQVKLRGPFLSLSEFVNRRLDASHTDLAVKGALQAALDDPEVSINSGFRNPAREISDAEAKAMGADFPEAAEGPVAYGSSAYVDQADILRNFAAQLTPRGDTFVIRTYGDSLDAAGKVRARAWCEAVVQRLPEYVDPVDEARLPTAELTSETNRNFGRKLRLVSFRWLNPSEV